MNIACSSCPAKYAVPDEKVRGRKVRITCKRCGAAIIVDGTDVGAATAEEPQAEAPKAEAPKADAPKAEVPKAAAAKTEAAERPKQRTMLGGLQAAPQAAEPAPAKGIALPKPGAAKAAPAGGAAFPSPAKAVAATVPKAAVGTPAAKAAAAPAATPKAPAEKPWTVAVTDDDHRDMVTTQVVELYATHTIDAETFIWRDGMEDWLTPFEIPDIAAALKARGLEPRTNDPVEDATAEARQSGSWREPGKWKAGDGQKKPDATFDDVTVAMTAPKAQALLDAAISAEEANANANKVAEAVEAKPEAPTAPPPMDTAPPPVDTATPVTTDALGFGSDAAPEAPFRLPFEEPAEADGGVVSSTAAPARAAVSPRRADRVREDAPDLFATAAAAEEPGPRSRMPSVPPEAGQAALTGARNESSVLFSLDQLAGKPKAKAAPKRNDKAETEALLLGNASDDDAPPSVANLGGGALFGGAAAMAAPDFMAPTAASAPQHSRPSSGAPPQAPAAASSRTGLFVALGAILLIGGGAAFVMLKPTPAPPAPEVTSQVATPPPPATMAAVQAAPSASAPTEVASAAASAGAPSTPPLASGAAPSPTPTAGTAAPTTSATAPTTAAAAKPQTPAASTAAATTPKPATTASAAAAAPQAAAEGPDFDKDAASAALASAAAAAEGQCASMDGNHGVGKVQITFTNSGRATNALVSGDFAGSALGGCVARIFRSAHVPAFAGEPVRVTKTVRIP